MYGVSREDGWRAGLLLALVLFLPVRAAADPAPYRLQLFSELEHRVVAVGAPIILGVSVYATPGTPEQARQIEAAFLSGTLQGTWEAFELLRREEEPVRRVSFDGGPEVLVLSARFILRAWQTGSLQVPSFVMTLGAAAYRTPAHGVQVYRVDPSFFSAREAVVPVRVEARDVETRRIYRRHGSAFLVAPDAFVTSYHVVMEASRVEVTLPTGRRLRLDRAWAVDPVHDVVVLYVNPKETHAAGMVPLRLAATEGGPVPVPDPAGAGDVVFTYGWPGGVQRSTAARRFDDVVLTGAERLWISANPVRPGDSGGPLLNGKGEVLGVVSAGTVLAYHRDVLREEVCIASDPRPALAQRRLGARPRLLDDFFEDPAFQSMPHVLAFRLSSLLLAGHRRQALFDAWLALFEAAVAQWQTPDPGLHFVQGMIHQLLGTTEDAAAAYRAALDTYGDYFPAAYMLGRYHMEAGRYALAERFFRRTRRYPPYRHLGAYGQAQALMKLLRYEHAIPLLQAVLHHDAGFGPALYDLALCRLALGDLEAVRILHARLFEISPPWARRLRQVLRTPALQPITLLERPRATLRQPPL